MYDINLRREILKRPQIATPDSESNITKGIIMIELEFIGKTKDGSYGRKVQIQDHANGDDIIYTAKKVITENGYVDLTARMDPDGKLISVTVERTNIGV